MIILPIFVGYKNYVEMSMDTKMADSVESVLALIKNLSGKAKQGQETELEEMQSYANSRAFEGDIDVFDIEYFRFVWLTYLFNIFLVNCSLKYSHFLVTLAIANSYWMKRGDNVCATLLDVKKTVDLIRFSHKLGVTKCNSNNTIT